MPEPFPAPQQRQRVTPPVPKITTHAIERARRRLGCQTDAEAVCVLSSPAIARAAAFGARFVRLSTGHRVVIKDNTVVTILPPGNYRKQVHRIGTAKFGKFGKR